MKNGLNILMDSLKMMDMLSSEDVYSNLDAYMESMKNLGNNITWNMEGKSFKGEKGYTLKCDTINFKCGKIEASMMLLFRKNKLINYKIK